MLNLFLVMINSLKQTKTFSLFKSLFTTVHELSGVFITTSAPLFTIFTGFLKNDKIGFEDMTTLLISNSLTCYKMMFRQDNLLDLTTSSMICENRYMRVKIYHTECHDTSEFLYLFCKLMLRKKFTL